MLGDYLATRHTEGAYLWSSAGPGKYLKVGNTFDAYEWGKRITAPAAWKSCIKIYLIAGSSLESYKL